MSKASLDYMSEQDIAKLSEEEQFARALALSEKVDRELRIAQQDTSSGAGPSFLGNLSEDQQLQYALQLSKSGTDKGEKRVVRVSFDDWIKAEINPNASDRTKEKKKRLEKIFGNNSNTCSFYAR